MLKKLPEAHRLGGSPVVLVVDDEGFITSLVHEVAILERDRPQATAARM